MRRVSRIVRRPHGRFSGKVWMMGLLAACMALPAAGQSYRLYAIRSPFSFRAIHEGTAVEELAADTAHTALFYLTTKGASYLESPVSFDTSSTRLDAEYLTSDGRRAHLSIRPVHGRTASGEDAASGDGTATEEGTATGEGTGSEEGTATTKDALTGKPPTIGFRVDLTFIPDDGILGVGDMLRARFDERFTFRGPDSTVEKARGRMIELDGRTAGSSDRLDRRLDDGPAPSYWSSAGYGVILHTSGSGYVDLGSRVADIIRLHLQGTALSYTVVFGDFDDVFREDG